MIPVVFHPEAQQEAVAAGEYYETQQRGLGRRFVEALAEAVQHIQATPHLYHIVSGVYRQCRVRRFPYGIIFRAGSDQIEIIAVMHLHRAPGFWRSRVD